MRDPERCEYSDEIEKGVRPLVEALNRCRNTRTFGSCQGHFGVQEPELLNSKCYVEFRMPRSKATKLKQAIYESVGVSRCKIEMDDYLPGDDAYFYGSIFIIPDENLEAKAQRRVADGMINRITEIVTEL